MGLLPCLALLSVSAAITLAAFILTDPTQKTQVLSWELLCTFWPSSFSCSKPWRIFVSRGIPQVRLPQAWKCEQRNGCRSARQSQYGGTVSNLSKFDIQSFSSFFFCYFFCISCTCAIKAVAEVWAERRSKLYQTFRRPFLVAIWCRISCHLSVVDRYLSCSLKLLSLERQAPSLAWSATKYNGETMPCTGYRVMKTSLDSQIVTDNSNHDPCLNLWIIWVL